MPTTMSDSSAPVTSAPVSAPVTLNPLRWPDPLRWLVLGARDMMAAPGPLIPAHALPKGQANGGDQEHLTALGGWDLLPEWNPRVLPARG